MNLLLLSMRASWLWAGSASFFCHPPCPVGLPFGILTYPVGRVGVIHASAWKVNSANFAITEFCEVRCCAQSMQKDCPPSWIAGRILQGRGRNEVMGVRRHPLWCMPDQPITGRGMKEIYAPRRAAAVPHDTLCHGAHTSSSPRSMVRSLP